MAPRPLILPINRVPQPTKPITRPQPSPPASTAQSENATVAMSWIEYQIAIQVAVARQIENLQKGRPDRYGCAMDTGWQMHIDGAAGEAAFAKYMGIYWSGSLGDLKADDVGSFQVRTCNPAGKKRTSLILHEADDDSKLFVLVLGPTYSENSVTFTFPGWIVAKEGKSERFWNDPTGKRPAYFVPIAALNPMSTFPRR
jgi:hypothetical protein